MVRFANENDLPFLKHAWNTCFDDPDDFVSWNFERNFSYRDTLIAEWDGKPASNLQLMPHTLYLRGHSYDINYVSGVATLPEYRHKGLVRALFASAFPVMRQRNQPISLLIPFQYAFYEKFGYKQCYRRTERHFCTSPPAPLLDRHALNRDLIARLDRLYLFEMRNKNGYILRTTETWQRILEDLLFVSKGKILFHRTRGTEDGYALLSQKKDGLWEIHEQCGVPPVAAEETQQPFAMARIIDPKRILLDLSENLHGTWRIKIVDEHIRENNVTAALSKNTWTPCEAYDTEIHIKQLAQLILGYIDDFTGTGLFPKTEPYLNMIF